MFVIYLPWKFHGWEGKNPSILGLRGLLAFPSGYSQLLGKKNGVDLDW